MATGATYEADGITDRPAYAFSPPAAFFEAGEPSGPGVIDIRDFGAVAGAHHDNTGAIQAAIQAAHDAGGGVVYIPPGTWGVGPAVDGYGCIHLMNNVFLKGAGMGESSLRLMDGSSGDVTGIVRTVWGEATTNCGIADFGIDGNKASTTGKVDGFFTGPEPGSTIRDADVYVLRVDVHDVSRYGFDPHEQTERLSIVDSKAHDCGVDGFVLDYNIDAELTGNESYGNGRHGFNFVTVSHDILLTNNVAHDNGGAGFVIQRGSENIDSSHSITLKGGASYDNGREGVLVNLSHDVVIEGMDISGNGHEGVRISGSSNVTVTGNDIDGNSQSASDAYSEVTILAYDDDVYGRHHAAQDNLIEGNSITSTGMVRARYGIEERIGDTGGNVVVDNDISGTLRGPLSLTGVDSFVLGLGSDAADALVGTSTSDHLLGGLGADTMSGQDGNDLVEGGSGNDAVTGGKGHDVLDGGADDDLLDGNSGNDTLLGGAGDDTLVGSTGDDHLAGGDGNDDISGGSGDDLVLADAGDDVLNGGSGFDVLDFSAASGSVLIDLSAKTATGMGNDTVTSFEAVLGGAFDDMLKGDSNANLLVGGAGNDTLRGMAGADTLTGGDGVDVFQWGSARDVVDKTGVHLGLDHVTDLVVGQDVLDVRGLVGSQAWSAIADIVQMTDTAEGTMLSVRIAGTFQDVAMLDGRHGLDVSTLFGEGVLLV